MSDTESIPVSEIVQEQKIKSNRGRKPKYADNEARKIAKREQNRSYRERKRNELERLRNIVNNIQSNSGECEFSSA